MVGRDQQLSDFDDDLTVGEFELEERKALRRVEGLSTELEDITEVEYRQVRLERVVLVGVWTSGTLADAENSMTELARLAETAGCVIVDAVIQRRQAPDPATFIGSGKVAELRGIVAAENSDTIIVDGELSPGQLRKLEEQTKVKVVDRTWLILDIFAAHAKSREGKAQVSLAQMQYMLPRLRGWGEAMSRQAGGRAGGASGGVGTRGPGETKLETDRRRIRDQMAKLRKELREMAKARNTQRSARRASGLPQVAIAGYTNAGKSSMLNRLTGAGVLVENALFATLDPTVRKARTPKGREVTLADTVGFVRHLPHSLVEAFRSTLEEVSDAELIIHVVDGSEVNPQEQIAAVREVLAEIGAGHIPELIAINKADIADPITIAMLTRAEPNSVVVSAHTGAGVDALLARVDEMLTTPNVRVKAHVPYSRGDLLSRVLQHGVVDQLEHTETGTDVVALVEAGLAHELEPFATLD